MIGKFWVVRSLRLIVRVNSMQTPERDSFASYPVVAALLMFGLWLSSVSMLPLTW